MDKKRKETIQVWSAIGMLIVGCALVVAGFIVPPVGDISDSVLWMFGECLIYAGSIFGIGIYVHGKIQTMRHELRLPPEEGEDLSEEETA